MEQNEDNFLKSIAQYDQKIMNISGMIYYLKDRLYRERNSGNESEAKKIEEKIKELYEKMKILQMEKASLFTKEIEKKSPSTIIENNKREREDDDGR